jgi:RNA polymerase sigma-70 factor (ECF subfamily)
MNTAAATGIRGGKDSGDGASAAADIGRIDGLYRKYSVMVLRRCRRLLGAGYDAEDAAQEVFAQAVENRKALAEGFASALLWKMATDHCIDVLRKRARRGGGFDGETLLERIACADDPDARIHSRGVLRKLFAKHPESTRAIAALHFLDGMTLEETARTVNMSVSGVRKRLKALSETLKGMEDVL